MKSDLIENAFMAAFAYAINKNGISVFKKSSFFGSNERVFVDLKKAA